MGSLVLLVHPFLLRPAERGTVLVTEDNTGSVHTPGTFLTGVCWIWTELPIALRLEQKNAVTIIRDNLDDKKLPMREISHRISDVLTNVMNTISATKRGKWDMSREELLSS